MHGHFTRSRWFCGPLLVMILATAGQARAQGDSARTARVGAFVDGYFAWDMDRPRLHDRAYTTQAARHNEFNINLAHLEAAVSGARLRGRLALQAGTSVQANYAGEPRRGSISGPELARHIQEANAGVLLGRGVWLDAGIFLSHVGSESWISRDNLTYTRSLIADYSPYYQSGARLSWQAAENVSLQLNVVNGWQVISETNTDKTVGLRVDWTVRPGISLAAYNLLGNEAPDSLPRQWRAFQGASLRVAPGDAWVAQLTADVGVERRDGDDVTWWGTALVARRRVARSAWLVVRGEAYRDPHEVLVPTTTGLGFRATGASIGWDATVAEALMWRTEVRALRARDRIMPGREGLDRGNVVLVSSLSLSFP